MQTQVRFAHLLHDVEAFDARLFSTDGIEASLMDPQQRLLLECVVEASLLRRPANAAPASLGQHQVMPTAQHDCEPSCLAGCTHMLWN